jgi:hypothetical protein
MYATTEFILVWLSVLSADRKDRPSIIAGLARASDR